LPNIIPGQKI